jgi:hypothetical protein
VREANAQSLEKEITSLTEKLRVSELARETLYKAYMRLSMGEHAEEHVEKHAEEQAEDI